MKAKAAGAPNRRELSAALSGARVGLLGGAGFSLLINLMMLAGPIYMMLVYDRVLTSGSVPTLAGLSVLVAGLFVCMGTLTLVRSRLLVRVGNRLTLRLDERVFTAHIRQTLTDGGTHGADATRDLSMLRDFCSGPTLATLFDAPWSPVFVFVVYLLHPVLGMIAAGGFILLILFGMANDLSTRRRLGIASEKQAGTNRLLADAARNAEAVGALRMTPGLLARWQTLQRDAQSDQSRAADNSGAFAAVSRMVRLMLQSAVLGAGVYLVLQHELSAGAIIAASIIMGRGLAPAEQAIGAWRTCVSARGAWTRLAGLLTAQPQVRARMRLPGPVGDLRLEKLYAAPPGQTMPVLQGVGFELAAGETLAVVGPSGAGKSTLARVLVGIWTPMRGEVRIDGASLDHWPDRQLGEILGYLPQDVELFDGTVRENIARFAQEIDDGEVVDAARRAGAHDMILQLRDGYDTPLGEGGRQLSGGQRQRIALARALYGGPRVVVLDEPNASLDQPGEAALLEALSDLKAAGVATIVIAHRPSVLGAVDKILVLEAGRVTAFGPKDEVIGALSSAVRVGPQKVVSMPRASSERS